MVQSILYPASLLPSPEICCGSRGMVHLCTGRLLASQGSSNLSFLRPSAPVTAYSLPHMGAETITGVWMCRFTCLCVFHSWSQHPGQHEQPRRRSRCRVSHVTTKTLLCSFPLSIQRFKCLLLYSDSIITLRFSICNFQIFIIKK